MADNSARVARDYLLALDFAGDTALYEKVAVALENALKEEREIVLVELIKLRDAWSDDVPATIFYQEAVKALLKRWEYVNDL